MFAISNLYVKKKGITGTHAFTKSWKFTSSTIRSECEPFIVNFTESFKFGFNYFNFGSMLFTFNL